MAKAGAAIGCSSVDPTPTRLYAFPTNGAAGRGPVSYITSCGGFRFYLSVNAIAAILCYLRYTSEPVSAETRALIYDGELGNQRIHR